jgi:methylenetetrahydrofolate reductase (NADH)
VSRMSRSAPSVAELLNREPTTFSFEFFPPKVQAGWDKLYRTVGELVQLRPGYVSVTYGAGGGTRENTHKLVLRIQRETGLTVVAHLTCVGHTISEIDSIVKSYWDEGVRNILALRGDEPSRDNGVSRQPAGERPSDFAHAGDLVAFIKERYPSMTVGVAGFPEGHPGTPNRLEEMRHLRDKVDAGADYVVTQLFFENRDYYDFAERCRIVGIGVPVVAGIMPIVSRSSMERMANLAAGARYPAQLLRSLARAEEKDQFRRVGVHWATEQVSNLLNHDVCGIHLYTLNASTATRGICDSLGLSDYGGTTRPLTSTPTAKE